MSAAAEFLDQTRSAVRKLLEGIDDYRKHFAQGIEDGIYVTGAATPEERSRGYEEFARANRDAIERSRAAWSSFHAERYARALLCGAVLELAWKSIELRSSHSQVPETLQPVVGKGQRVAKFAIGRPVLGMPIGLLIYAARNQHVHYNDEELHEVNRNIFDSMSRHGRPLGSIARELDLTLHRGQSLANNMIFLLGWFTLDDYERDMLALLQPFDDIAR